MLAKHDLQPLVYTADGYLYPTAGLSHMPGFNGELPEPLTGNYLLGNGYRAYNPVLMRFNSPDSLSPFGEGGINAYGYCLGDPVNSLDPAGHIPLLKGIGKWLGSFSPPKPATNIKKVTQGIISFEKKSAKNRTLTLLGHGTTKPVQGFEPMHLAMEGGNALTPKALYNRLIDAGITPEHYKKIKLMICFSGSGDTESFAAAFASLTKTPVKGYKGLTFTNMSPQDVEDLIALRSKDIRKLSSGEHELARGIYTLKKNINKGTRETFSYRPVNITPL